MFGLLARGVSAFVASVSGNQKDDSGMEGSSNEDVNSVKSTNSSIRRTSDSSKGIMTANRQQFNVEHVKEANLDEVVQFLIDNFAETEAIMSSLRISEQNEMCREELTVMLRDIVQDSLQCSSTCVVRDPSTKKIDGVALACKTSIFDKQIDRLCAYQFRSQRLNDAVEFLKYVFNKLDVMYYLSEHRVYKPIFVALVCVRREMWNKGIGTSLMNHVRATARADSNDGLISLCSNQNAHNLMIKYCPTDFAAVRYDAFKGEHRAPPIVMSPSEPFNSVYAMIAKFQ